MMINDSVKEKNTQQKVTKEKSSHEKMLAGSAWMSGGSIVSRLLGALYIIPWMAWMGSKDVANGANALYNIGYTPYALFLSMATAGVPSAIAKQVSHYNALGEYRISRNIYKKGLQLMTITGVLTAIAMYLLAPLVAAGSPTASVDEGTQVIRSLTWALLIIPSMSVTRGFIQGHHNMAPSAISQVIEQVARVIFMLASVYIIREVMGGEVVDAVSLSTFGAFIGALFSIFYLLTVMWRMKPEMDNNLQHSVNQVEVSTNQILKSIVRTAIPFVIIGAGITFFQIVDQFTFQPIMQAVSDLSPSEILSEYGVAAANTHKLIMLIMSFGSSMAITSVPLISGLVAERKMEEVGKQFSNTLQLLFFIMLPASVGMAVVAGPIYAVFYGYSEFGRNMTVVAAFMTMFLGVYTLMGLTMQASGNTRPALKALAIGLLVKLLVQYPLLDWFGTYGMLVSNMVGFSVSSLLMLRTLHKATHFNIRLMLRRILLIALLTVVMAIATIGAREVLYLFLSPESRSGSILIVAIVAVVGVAVFAVAALKTRLADRLIGKRVSVVRKKLRMK